MPILTPQPRVQLTAEMARPSRERSEGRAENLLWLDKNENMDSVYLNLTKKVLQDIPSTSLFGYPDCHALYQKLSAYLNKQINQLFIAAGSDGVIRSVFEAYISPGDTVIYTEPTFAMYAVYAKMYGARSVLLQYEPSPQGPLLTVNTIVEAIHQEKPRLVCLPNPNSPSGTAFVHAQLRRIIQAAAEEGAVILIDEAYFPFYAETVVDWVDEYPHLVVARTFSKAWGLAGIRLGFGVGSQTLISELHKIRPMYEAGALSITIAERILDYNDDMLASVKRLNAGKAFFLEKMHRLGFKTFHSEGNFLHVAFGKHAEAVHTLLSDKVLYRKDFSHPSLAGYSRFTATTEDVFAPLVKDIKNLVG